jgi:hypothetical protein
MCWFDTHYHIPYLVSYTSVCIIEVMKTIIMSCVYVIPHIIYQCSRSLMIAGKILGINPKYRKRILILVCKRPARPLYTEMQIKSFVTMLAALGACLQMYWSLLRWGWNPCGHADSTAFLTTVLILAFFRRCHRTYMSRWFTQISTQEFPNMAECYFSSTLL